MGTEKALLFFLNSLSDNGDVAGGDERGRLLSMSWFIAFVRLVIESSSPFSKCA